MKKFLLMSAAVTAALSAAPAFAAPDSSAPSIAVTMTMPQLCQVTKQPTTVKVTPTYNENTSSAEFGNMTGFTTDTTSNNVHVFCNTPGSSLAVSATSLVGQTTASSGATSAGFTSTADYCALLTGGREADTSGAVWEARSKTDGAHCAGDGHQFSSYAYGVYQGDLSLTLNNVAPTGGSSLIAGDYHGTVTITMQPDTSSSL